MKNKKSKTFLMPIVIEADGKSGMMGGAYTLAFVYSPRGNFLIKGYHREVKEYIEKTFNRAFVNYSLWHNKYGSKKYRTIWKFIGDRFSILEPQIAHKKGFTKWRIYDRQTHKVVLTFKRLPKTWIPEFSLLFNQ